MQLAEEEDRLSLEDVLTATPRVESVVLDAFGRKYGNAPLVLLENRTGQMVSNGQDRASVCRAVEDGTPEINSRFGIVLDVQQFFTKTVARSKDTSLFLSSFSMVPDEALRRIHCLHGMPSHEKPIPWRDEFARLRRLRNDSFINREVHHRNATRCHAVLF